MKGAFTNLLNIWYDMNLQFRTTLSLIFLTCVKKCFGVPQDGEMPAGPFTTKPDQTCPSVRKCFGVPQSEENGCGSNYSKARSSK